MKRKGLKRILALSLAAITLFAATGCGGSADESAGGEPADDTSSVVTEESNESTGEEAETEAETAGSTGEVATVTIYPANTSVPSGVVDGYKAEIFAEYGLQPEIWAYSDEKTNAILASGDLPDLMYVTYDNLETLIKGGMVMPLDDMVADIPLIAESELLQTAFNYVREFKSAGTGQLYGIPIGTRLPLEMDGMGRNPIKVNWPVYYALGCPEVKDFWDLIPLMKQMMEAQPTAEDGTKTWGTVLSAGVDNVYWRNSELWYKWHGYEPDNMAYLIETDMVNEEYHNILEEGRDSLYYECLQFYNKAYLEGVLDPDSINNDRETQKTKVETSKAVMIPGGSTPGWTGYKELYIEGQKLYQENWSTPYGRDCFLVVNAKTANLDACRRCIEVLADSDVFYKIWNGTEDLGLWYTADDGMVYPTEEGQEATVAAAEGGEVFFSNGEKQQLWLDDFIGDVTYARTFKGPKGFYEGENGERGARTMLGWSEIKEITDNTEENNQWKELYGYENLTELLKANDGYTLVSGLSYVSNFCETPDPAMQLTLNAIRETVVNASWKMVYAESEQEFEGYWDQMIQDCKDLGAEDVIQWRFDELQKAQEKKESLEAK